MPALAGAALTPTLYLIVCELCGPSSPWAGGLAGLLCLLDTAFLAQSRYILLESTMMLFSFAAVLSVLKMRRYNNNSLQSSASSSSSSSSPLHRPGWWFWLISAAINMGLAFSVKYLAFYSCALCTALLARDFWRLR